MLLSYAVTEPSKSGQRVKVVFIPLALIVSFERPFTESIPTSIFFTISLRHNLSSIIEAFWNLFGQSVVTAGPMEMLSSQMAPSKPTPASISFNNTRRASSRSIESPMQIETTQHIHQEPQHVTDIATLISEDVLEKCSEATQNAVRASKSFDEVYNEIRLIDRSRHDESFAEPWNVLRKVRSDFSPFIRDLP